ncbi:thiamine/thiamine pyrophosphate ABC transporter permease ThiP [Agrobacterium sp. AGB01]|uniref:thiamine/thiamine pyrophosphate ABC transporter permease ThiP n=1 Tax=Agrobacterium sp. AGB01 TaxID=2769302 RepID=UPI001781FD2E|nr:thiamine/thiamine pyrophosphate ABC transporter permease ThiP [Agrobacterium sp. AGB01]MBD9389526.1 thiamine/thiamine pyrophosphate ABC transporter permease ThiP [Agrobacterium sp. AGB01]
MISTAEQRQSIGTGMAAFAAVLAFIGLGTFALLSFDAGAASDELFGTYTWRILRFTLYQATLSTGLSILFALPVALALARQTVFPGRIWIIRLMAVPMGLPVIVGALGLIAIWGRQGFLNTTLTSLGVEQPFSIYGLSGILLAHVFFNLPLATRLLLAGLERIPGEYWRMAASLGMPSWSIFRFIEWPALIKLVPGVAGLIFMLCATSFTLVLMLGGGPAATTLEVAIYQSLRFDFDPPRAIALATLQIVMTGLLLALLSWLPRPDDEGLSHGRTIQRYDGKRLQARLRDGILIIAAVVFMVAPLLSIAISGSTANLSRLLAADVFWRAAGTSLSIALVSASIAIGISVALINARSTIRGNRKANLLLRLIASAMSGGASMVLLVPPVVLGSGWFLLLRPLGDITLFAPALVACINMLMALPFVMRVLEPAFQTHQARTGRLSASLGMGCFARLRYIHWPILRKPLATAFSFAMALSLGDLGAIALFGSQNFITLPWLVYSNMGSYRTNDADGYALILGVICLILAMGGAGTSQTRKAQNQ